MNDNARLTDLDLDALAAREQAATPAPWAAWPNSVEGPENLPVVTGGTYADHVLIADLRDAAPDLIAAAQRERWHETSLAAARAEVAALRERVEAVVNLWLASAERTPARQVLSVDFVHEAIHAALDDRPTDYLSAYDRHNRVRAALATKGDQ